MLEFLSSFSNQYYKHISVKIAELFKSINVGTAFKPQNVLEKMFYKSKLKIPCLDNIGVV